MAPDDDNFITGDRVLGLCDAVVTCRRTFGFHKHAGRFVKSFVLLEDMIRNPGPVAFAAAKANGGLVRVFVYGHLLEVFVDRVLPKLDPAAKYVVYVHNSDEAFSETKYWRLVEDARVVRVLAQNADYPLHPKVGALPIGIANSMWPHGDLGAARAARASGRSLSKPKAIYVNISPGTWPHRQRVLDRIELTQCWPIAKATMPYPQYLAELAQHRFCFCVRGNGLDTHRFWESLYLGVIPVVLQTPATASERFYAQLAKLGVPFFRIETDKVDTFPASFFDQALYEQLMAQHPGYDLALRLETYRT
jgi:hypothetical protein